MLHEYWLRLKASYSTDIIIHVKIKRN